jgi:hypothetical protein
MTNDEFRSRREASSSAIRMRTLERIDLPAEPCPRGQNLPPVFLSFLQARRIRMLPASMVHAASKGSARGRA